MTWNYTLSSWVLHFTAIISVAIAFIASHRRSMPGAMALCLLMSAIAEWAFMSGWASAATDLSLIILLTKIEYLGVISAPTLFLIFCLEYLQYHRWLNWRKVILLSIVPVATLIITATNEMHNLVWTGFMINPDNPNLVIFEHGPGYYVQIIYSYSILMIGLGLLVRAWILNARPNRSRISIILAGSLIPIITGIIYVTGGNPVPGLDFVPISFSITGIIIAYGIFRMRIFNIVPVARENLIENMTDGILVVDRHDCVVDINTAAQKTIGITAEEIIGKPASQLPKEWADAVTQTRDTYFHRKEISLQTTPAVHLDIQTTPLHDRKNLLNGRLIVFRDITERRNAEMQLEMRANELGILNQISLAITSGLDLNNVMRTLHEECSAIIPCNVFYIALYDEITGVIEMPLYHETKYQVRPPRDINRDPGYTGHIIKTKQTLYIPDTVGSNADGNPVPTPIRIGGTPARSYVGIPLLLRDKVIGVMSVQSYQPGAYNPEQVRLLETVAVEAAIAIENARMYGEIQRLAIIDELTGVYNYRGLIELGKRELERAHRFDRPLAALFFDIDGFRNFNNQYSHTVGNLVLKAITERISSVLRSVDVFGRYGGDEFVVLLPETEKQMALNAAKRLLTEVAGMQVRTKEGELSVTISIGLAMLTNEISSIGALIDHANRAEHKAKKIGNCVEVETKKISKPR